MLDFLRVVVIAVILAGDRGGQRLLQVEQRIDHAVAGRFEHDVEIAVAHRLEPGPGRHDPLLDLQSDLAPLVDQPGRDVFEGLVDIAVEKLEGEPLGPGLLQQPPRLGPRLFDVGPEPGDLLQLLFGRRQWRAGEDDPADRLDDRDFRYRRRAVPAVDRQGQCAADPRIVERLALVIGGDARWRHSSRSPAP